MMHKKNFNSPILLAFAFLALLFGKASAHGVELLRSEPADGSSLEKSPALVQAWFNEEMQTKVSTLQVFDAGGKQVDNGDGGVDLEDAAHASMKVSLPPLAGGVYTARWHVVLLDGDASDGQFTFTVTQGETTVSSSPNIGSGGASSLWLAAGGAVVLLIVGGAVVILRKR